MDDVSPPDDEFASRSACESKEYDCLFAKFKTEKKENESIKKTKLLLEDDLNSLRRDERKARDALETAKQKKASLEAEFNDVEAEEEKTKRALMEARRSIKEEKERGEADLWNQLREEREKQENLKCSIESVENEIGSLQKQFWSERGMPAECY
jgi:chromosome segregation ATPase